MVKYLYLYKGVFFCCAKTDSLFGTVSDGSRKTVPAPTIKTRLADAFRVRMSEGGTRQENSTLFDCQHKTCARRIVSVKPQRQFIRRCLSMRVKITLACSDCKQRNYDTMKNKKNDPDRLELKKYCRFCRKHTLHKETK